jgi:uncharacterized membrane protein
MAAAGARRVQGIEVAAVEDAVRAAELRTSGEIRVAVVRFVFWGDVRRAAERAFVRLGMTRTRERNGVLIFVAPRRHRFAVLGDVGIHEKVGAKFWSEVVDKIAAELRRGDITAGLVAGVKAVGEALSSAFPYVPGRDVNELPDTVATKRR